MREQNPSLFNSQLINKLWYAAVGGGETIKPTYPNLVGITCLNIPYYAGGGLPLGGNEDYFCYSDGILEVIGFRNIIHCATTRVGIGW